MTHTHHTVDNLYSFIKACIKVSLKGGVRFYLWIGFLTLVILLGLGAYIKQLDQGLIVTNMSDHVSWGFYISNFTFLVGVAAAAVMLVIPAYVFADTDFSKVVLIGEGVAIAAVCMCLAFVTVDMGGPERLWHIIPKLGYFNWPSSMLTWDVVVLNGYLVLNVFISFYVLFKHYEGEQPDKTIYLPFVFLSIIWAFAIHLVTAYLYVAVPARPYWHSSLLGPRFLASAFAAGPAFIIIVLLLIRKLQLFEIRRETVEKISIIMTAAAQVNLVMLMSEIFKEFYQPTEHSLSALYLFFGLDGHNGLVMNIWIAVCLNVVATGLLTIHPIRNNFKCLVALCGALFVSIWIEKGMGLVVPGFIPSPLGEIVEYSPSLVEWTIGAGIWAMGFLILTLLLKGLMAVENGIIRLDMKNGTKD